MCSQHSQHGRWSDNAGAAVQAQTAECLVVGEIAIQHMVVILNKVDLLPAEHRAKLVGKAKKRLAQTFAATKFAGCPMLAVSSLPGASGPTHTHASTSSQSCAA